MFFLDNAVTTLVTDVDYGFTPWINENEPEQPLAGTHQSLSFDSYEHRITSVDYRYEHWTQGASEFAVNAYRIDPAGTPHWIYDDCMPDCKVINQISMNDIGDMQYVWSYHAANWLPWSNPWTPDEIQYGVNMVFWNTFERDWNRSEKTLGTCTASGTTIYLRGRRKYTSEWYAWIPETTQVHYTRFEWIYDNWAHWNNSYKSDFRLWRVGG